MMTCPKCGAQNEESAKFCSACGTLLAQTGSLEDRLDQNYANAVKTVTSSKPQSKDEVTVRKIFRFSSPDEKFLASIGNSFIDNFLSGGKMSQTIAALTDKRLYYRGHTLTGNGLKISKMTEEGSVAVRDITYTGFIYSNPIWRKIVGIILIVIGGFYTLSALIALPEFVAKLQFFDLLVPLFCLCFLVPGVILLRKYKQKNTSVFIIRFGGGGLAFDINSYPIGESKHFQDMLNRAIDAKE